MTWNYIFGNSEAIHKETGARFTISYRTEVLERIDDFEIGPDPSSKKKFDIEALRSVKEDLWIEMAAQQQDRRRRELNSLINDRLLGENNRAAAILCQTTGRNVSERTIQAWLIDPRKRSSRNCPHWAIKALKDYLENPENQTRLDEIKNYHREFSKPYSSFAKVFDKYAVGSATASIEADERRRAEWDGASLSSLPEMICELERKYENNLSYLNKANGILWNAMRTGKNFDDFKEMFLSGHDEMGLIDSEIRRTRSAIEEKLGEFASPDGLPE